MASAISNLNAVITAGNNRFNAEAAAWDSRPFVHSASAHANTAILSRLAALSENDSPDHASEKQVSDMDVLEIGCGTGILSFLLAERVRAVVAVDAAEGMIDVLRRKISQKQEASRREGREWQGRIVPVAVLLEDGEDARMPAEGFDFGSMKGGEVGDRRKRYDLVTSHLVLHHIPDLEGVLGTMLGCLREGGRVMLTDFEDYGPEARRFHPESKMEGVARHGINREEMTALMKRVGFVNVQVNVAWSMEKMAERFPGELGETGSAPKDGGEMIDVPFVLCYGEKRVAS